VLGVRQPRRTWQAAAESPIRVDEDAIIHLCSMSPLLCNLG
jgi:hypothetical protein